jgi:hypothetical protein
MWEESPHRKNDQLEVRVEHPQRLTNFQHGTVSKIHIQESERGVFLIRANNRFAFSFGDLDPIAFLLKSME